MIWKQHCSGITDWKMDLDQLNLLEHAFLKVKKFWKSNRKLWSLILILLLIDIKFLPSHHQNRVRNSLKLSKNPFLRISTIIQCLLRYLQLWRNHNQVPLHKLSEKFNRSLICLSSILEIPHQILRLLHLLTQPLIKLLELLVRTKTSKS